VMRDSISFQRDGWIGWTDFKSLVQASKFPKSQ
jgi:hypothetical protein